MVSGFILREEQGEMMTQSEEPLRFDSPCRICVETLKFRLEILSPGLLRALVRDRCILLLHLLFRATFKLNSKPQPLETAETCN